LNQSHEAVRKEKRGKKEKGKAKALFEKERKQHLRKLTLKTKNHPTPQLPTDKSRKMVLPII